MNKLILSFLVSNALAATGPSSSIEFTSGSYRFMAEKSSQSFEVRDQLGTRKLEIKPCNRRVIETFWSELLTEAKTAKAAREKNQDSVVKLDGVASTIYSFQPAYASLLNATNRAHVVFFESERKCKQP